MASEDKQALRAIRNMPIDAPAQEIAESEAENYALWCVVAGEVRHVSKDGQELVTMWDDPVTYALFNRYLRTIPERVHETHDSAVAYVRSRLAASSA